MIQHLKVLATVTLVMLLLCPCMCAAQQSSPSDLFQRLQIDSSSDDAAARLLRNAKTGTETRAYLASHLPELIKKGPRNNPRVWTNGVKLAGELKISEAIPALVTWIGADDVVSNVRTLPEIEKLANNPAAKSLAQIGDPSVPAVSKVLNVGTIGQKNYAVYVLYNIHSAASMRALKEYSQSEADPKIKGLIDGVLSSDSPK
jgi:hypothetical protein